MSETFTLDPKTSSSVILTLFTNLRNASEIRENLKSGTTNFAAIKPDLIYDPFQVIVAANKAVCCEKLTTKTVCNEVLYNLSFSKNIMQSIQNFGLEENDKRVLIAMIVKNDALKEEKQQLNSIKGDVENLSQLRNFCNIGHVKKIYKLSDWETINNVHTLDSIISRIAAKDIIL